MNWTHTFFFWTHTLVSKFWTKNWTVQHFIKEQEHTGSEHFYERHLHEKLQWRRRGSVSQGVCTRSVMHQFQVQGHSEGCLCHCWKALVDSNLGCARLRSYPLRLALKIQTLGLRGMKKREFAHFFFSMVKNKSIKFIILKRSEVH